MHKAWDLPITARDTAVTVRLDNVRRRWPVWARWGPGPHGLVGCSEARLGVVARVAVPRVGRRRIHKGDAEVRLVLDELARVAGQVVAHAPSNGAFRAPSSSDTTDLPRFPLTLGGTVASPGAGLAPRVRSSAGSAFAPSHAGPTSKHSSKLLLGTTNFRPTQTIGGGSSVGGCDEL